MESGKVTAGSDSLGRRQALYTRNPADAAVAVIQTFKIC